MKLGFWINSIYWHVVTTPAGFADHYYIGTIWIYINLNQLNFQIFLSSFILLVFHQFFLQLFHQLYLTFRSDLSSFFRKPFLVYHRTSILFQWSATNTFFLEAHSITTHSSSSSKRWDYQPFASNWSWPGANEAVQVFHPGRSETLRTYFGSSRPHWTEQGEAKRQNMGLASASGKRKSACQSSYALSPPQAAVPLFHAFGTNERRKQEYCTACAGITDLVGATGAHMCPICRRSSIVEKCRNAFLT